MRQAVKATAAMSSKRIVRHGPKVFMTVVNAFSAARMVSASMPARMSPKDAPFAGDAPPADCARRPKHLNARYSSPQERGLGLLSGASLPLPHPLRQLPPDELLDRR